VDLLPQADSFTVQCFIDQILKPFNQEHSMKSADIARMRLRLHFHNSRCHAAKIVPDEMTRLKCKRVPHPPVSPDVSIADFDSFGVLEQKLQNIDASDGQELKSRILTIFMAFHRAN
jgi:hypothetical protein